MNSNDLTIIQKMIDEKKILAFDLSKEIMGMQEIANQKQQQINELNIAIQQLEQQKETSK